MKVKCFFKNKKLISNAIIFFTIFYLLCNSKIITESISNSCNIFITKLIPALFPYLLITEFLINSEKVSNLSYGLSSLISKLFHIPKSITGTVVIGYLLGYPNSAKYILHLYNKKQIDNKLATKLTAFTSNANMSYIIATIGISMFNNIIFGIILVISHFLSSIIIGVFLIPSTNNSIIQQTNTNSNSFEKIYSPFELLYTSIYGTLKTLAFIFAYTVIFSLIPIVIFNNIPMPKTLYSFVIALFEISNGINSIISLDLNNNLKLILVSFVLSFSSLMILIQIFSFVFKAKVKFKDLIKYKLLQGVLSSIITYIIVTYIYTPSEAVFSNINILTNNQQTYISTTSIYILLSVISIAIASLMFRKKATSQTCRLKRGILI